jgi:GntR family transcriptional regulator
VILVINRIRPLSEQIATIIKDRIRGGEYDKSGRLPSESELSESIGVSRSTVRMALASLNTEGLIIRKQGDGTYINKRAIEIVSQSRWEFTRLILDSGRTPSIKLIDESSRAATLAEGLSLEREPGDEVICVTRIFLADDSPVIYSINTLSKSLIKLPFSSDVWMKDIQYFLEGYCRARCFYNIVDICAELSGPKITKYLGIKPGSPIIKLTEIFYNEKQSPLFYAINYYNDKKIRLRFAQHSFT